MAKYEHKVLEIPGPEDIEPALADYGKEGWRIATAFTIRANDPVPHYKMLFVFEREVLDA